MFLCRVNKITSDYHQILLYRALLDYANELADPSFH